MCEITTALDVAVSLLVATSFCIYQVNPKVGHHSEINSESPCEKEHKKFCLNGGERYYLMDEDIAGCNCTWLYERKRCEKYMWCSKTAASGNFYFKI